MPDWRRCPLTRTTAQELEEDVFDEPSARPRVKSLKRPEVVAQEKGIATVRCGV